MIKNSEKKKGKEKENRTSCQKQKRTFPVVSFFFLRFLKQLFWERTMEVVCNYIQFNNQKTDNKMSFGRFYRKRKNKTKLKRNINKQKPTKTRTLKKRWMCEILVFVAPSPFLLFLLFCFSSLFIFIRLFLAAA